MTCDKCCWCNEQQTNKVDVLLQPRRQMHLRFTFHNVEQRRTTINQSINQSNQSIKLIKSINKIDQINQSIDQFNKIDQINRSTNQIYQSTNQINQSIDQFGSVQSHTIYHTGTTTQTSYYLKIHNGCVVLFIGWFHRCMRLASDCC